MKNDSENEGPTTVVDTYDTLKQKYAGKWQQLLKIFFFKSAQDLKHTYDKNGST